MNNRTPAKILGHLLGASAILSAIACGQILGVEETTLQEASCSDGKQNQNETGIDCGGPCSAACSAPKCPAATPLSPPMPTGTPLSGDWSCLGQIVPTPPATDSINITVSVSELGGGPLPDSTVGVCPTALDTKCDPEGQKTDATGTVTVTASTKGGGLGTERTGFNGYLVIKSPGYQPLLWFFPSALAADLPLLSASLFQKASWDSTVAGQISTCSNRKDRADFVAQVLNCNPGEKEGTLEGAGKVTFRIQSADQDSSPLLFGFPFSPGPGTLGKEAGAAAGLLAMYNLPPGPTTATFYDNESGNQLGPAFSFFFREGFNSTFVLPPR